MGRGAGLPFGYQIMMYEEFFEADVPGPTRSCAT